MTCPFVGFLATAFGECWTEKGTAVVCFGLFGPFRYTPEHRQRLPMPPVLHTSPIPDLAGINHRLPVAGMLTRKFSSDSCRCHIDFYCPLPRHFRGAGNRACSRLSGGFRIAVVLFFTPDKRRRAPQTPSASPGENGFQES